MYRTYHKEDQNQNFDRPNTIYFSTLDTTTGKLNSTMGNYGSYAGGIVLATRDG